MKIVFFGATTFSQVLLSSLIENKFNVRAVFTIPENFHIRGKEEVKNYNFADIKSLADQNNIPAYLVDGSRTSIYDYYDIIQTIQPDIILVLGWYYMIPAKIREIPRYGCCGIHGSLLPQYAGWAPLVWAIIKGEKETGVTFFKMDDSVDGGDIIAQKSFPILEHDTIKEVYDNAAKASEDILLETLPRLADIPFIKQDQSKIEIYPKRQPEDGEIDMTMNARDLYNFVRAQSAPYPGAFIRTIDGKKMVIEKVRIED